jgi:hypothetical protein
MRAGGHFEKRENDEIRARLQVQIKNDPQRNQSQKSHVFPGAVRFHECPTLHMKQPSYI